MKKMIVSDYDQTFYINDEDIKENNKTVQEFMKQGNLFTIATGRTFSDFKDIVKTYNIRYDYVILNHGSTILDNNDNIISNFFINNDSILNIKKDVCLEESIKWYCCSILKSNVDFTHKDLTKIHVKYDSKEKAMKMNDLINKKYSKYVNCYYVVNNSIEIISNEINKSNAINLLINKINVDRNNVYTIGDGYSDIDMIKDYNGFCMKNSIKELKKISIKEYDSVSQLIKYVLDNN